MLTTNQTEKVEVALSLIREVKREVIGTDYPKAVLLSTASDACNEVLQEVRCEVKEKDLSREILLGDAIAAIDEITQQDLPEGYIMPKPKEDAWEYKPTTGEHILNVLGWIAGTSLLSSALCACIALSSWGISEFKSASGWKTNTDYAAETRGYRGLCFAFLGVTLTCGVLGSVIGDAVYRSRD